MDSWYSFRLVLFQVEHVEQGRLKHSLRRYRFHSQSEGVFQQSVRIADAEEVLEFFRGLLRYNRERQKHSCPVLWLAARDLQPVVFECLVHVVAGLSDLKVVIHALCRLLL